jgi:hypothetical protein
MSHWSEDPAQVEERSERAEVAIEKMKEGLREFLATTQEDGDAEIVENAVLIFEAKGMSAASTYYKPGFVMLEFEGSGNSLIGLMMTEPAKVIQAAQQHRCSHQDDGGCG